MGLESRQQFTGMPAPISPDSLIKAMVGTIKVSFQKEKYSEHMTQQKLNRSYLMISMSPSILK